MNQILKQDKTVFGTFQTMKGVRVSQIICNSGVDVSGISCMHTGRH